MLLSFIRLRVREGGVVRHLREVSDGGQRGGGERQGARQRPHRGRGRRVAGRQVQPAGGRRAQAERECCYLGAGEVRTNSCARKQIVFIISSNLKYVGH